MENTAPEEKTIETLLAINGINKIDNFDDLAKYFNINQLDEDGTPEIVCENKVVIICDNEIFNETYLIDLINEYLETRFSIKESVEFIYIDDFDTRKKLLAPSAEEPALDEKHDFERDYLLPTIFTINPIANEFSAFSEGMATFTIDLIETIMTTAKIEE